MAKRRVAGRGRAVVATLLLGFVLVATSVIWRRMYGYRQATELARLEGERIQLEARQTRLETDIRDASSRARIAAIAEQRLRMHVPNDSLVINLPRPSTPRVSAPK